MEIKLPRSTHFVLYALSIISVVCAEFCVEYGHSCNEPHKCCGATCCIPSELEHHYRNQLRWSVWNMWYFWFVVLFVLMSCFGGCSYYRRHQLLLARHHSVLGEGSRTYPDWQFSPSFPISLFSGYNSQGGRQRAAASSTTTTTTTTTMQPVCPETQIPRQIFPSPPAYSEVVSHPDVYPPNKDPDLPPYPGPQTGFPTDGIVHLPPYSPPAGAVMRDTHHHGNQTHQIHVSGSANSDGHDNEASVVTSGGRTKYDCKTQTVSGFDE